MVDVTEIPNLRNLTERFRNLKWLFYGIFHSGYYKCLIYATFRKLGFYNIQNGIFRKIAI